MSEKTIKEAINELKDACVDKLIENIKECLASFDKLEEKHRFNEFAQGRTAIACCDNITEALQRMEHEDKIKLMSEYPEFKEIIMSSLTYLELGLTFDYTKKGDPNDK